MEITTLLRLPQVKHRVGFSRSQIYLLMNAGKFPRPVQLGPGSRAWVAAEIDEWCKQKIAARDRGEMKPHRSARRGSDRPGEAFPDAP